MFHSESLTLRSACALPSCAERLRTNPQAKGRFAVLKTEHDTAKAQGQLTSVPVDLLRCPRTGADLSIEEGALVSPEGTRYPMTRSGIPLFAAEFCSSDAKRQQEHYDRVAEAYLTNLMYPHTQEYMGYLDRLFVEAVSRVPFSTVAEICCGRGEAFQLIGRHVRRGIGVDISVAMLEAAVADKTNESIAFVQGDATMLPLASESFDTVVMLGGVHHVNDREKLFAEVARILKPGGRFLWREPVSDFFLWRWLRAVIYRISPALDAETERPLLYVETVPVLERVGLRLVSWETYGFLGFCFFMNSDVLVFNRLLRFLPGIRAITRLAIRLDSWTTGLRPLRSSGLQVIGIAAKPQSAA